MKVIWQGDISYVDWSYKQTLRICLFDIGETPKGYPLGGAAYLQGFEVRLGDQWFPMTESFIRKLSPIELIQALAIAAQSFTLSPSEPEATKRKGTKKAAPNALEVLTLSPAEKLVFDALEACPSFAGRIRDLPAFVAAVIKAFPRLDVLHEINHAHLWIVSNRDAAPKSKVDRFLNSWLSRANERLGAPSSPAPMLPIEEAPPTPRKAASSPIRAEIKTLAEKPFHGPRDARALASRIGSGMLSSPADPDQDNE